MKKLLIASLFTSTLLAPFATAASYVIDDNSKGSHASINFKIKHLGYSWLIGRFDSFSGNFEYDANDITASKITVNVDTGSFNSNHAERDKHIRASGFLDSGSFKEAKFVSSSFTDKGNDKFEIEGMLTLHGITKSIIIDAEKVGEGKDPWGGYRVGFSGTTQIGLTDFGMKASLGPDSTHVLLDLYIEGIRQ